MILMVIENLSKTEVPRLTIAFLVRLPSSSITSVLCTLGSALLIGLSKLQSALHVLS